MNALALSFLFVFSLPFVLLFYNLVRRALERKTNTLKREQRTQTTLPSYDPR
jgi:hypothetical protein